MKNVDNRTAFKELLEKEYFSLDRTRFEITSTNELADIEIRDAVYREFLNMLKLENEHKKYLASLGFLESSIKDGLYKSVPKDYIKRRLIANTLLRKYRFNIAGVPGFFQEEDFKWVFSEPAGFFVPVFNKDGYIQGLSIHLDEPYNNNQDIWFSSKDKINGTNARNWIMKNNLTYASDSVIITDNFLLGNLIKETINAPMIAFQNISNSYVILKEIEQTNVRNILFVMRLSQASENMDYIINRIFSDLIPLNYNLDIRYIHDYKDFFDENLSMTFALSKAA